MLGASALSSSTERAADGEEDAIGCPVGSSELVIVPALLPMAATLRAAVGGLLPEHPRRVDACQVVGEFAATALIEQRCACCPHEQITLTVDHDEKRIRLELSFHVTLSHAAVWKMSEYEDPVDTYGYGLALVDACCDRWGHIARQVGPTHYADKYHILYAELDHTGRRAPAIRGL